MPKIQNVLINLEKNELSEEELQAVYSPIQEMKNLKLYVLKLNDKKTLSTNPDEQTLANIDAKYRL